ncbi:MAG TPA: sugar ABC transporter permease [Streptosporangiaceae bacterium]|nr:sugar ABC transporter permease [Streptosporangiaceae bacterium]
MATITGQGRPVTTGRPAPAGHAKERGDRRLGYILVAPALILLAVVTAYPLVYNLWNSLHYDNLTFAITPHNFNGVHNYKVALSSAGWTSALERTLVFTVVTIVFDVVVALALALMLHRRFRGRGFLRAAVLIPWAVPTVVSAMLWKTMFDPRTGFVDYFLGAIHPAWSNLTWLNISVFRSWAAIFMADSWKNIPFVAIILLAGLQVIPNEVYEAAKIDGASWWGAFRRITLPMLKPALSVALIFRTLQALLVFDVIFVMTSGGPGTSTETLAYLNFDEFINKTDFGVGGAMSIMLVILALIISAIYVRAFRPQTVR